MAPSPTDISAALQAIPEKKEYVRKAFEELEEQRITLARCSKGWKDLDSQLIEISEALEKRYAEIVDKETKFEARMAELQSALDKRESVIESREQASLARVQEQKDAAIAAIREQKRKWVEERQLLQGQSPAKPDPDSKTKQKDMKAAPKEEVSAKKEKVKDDADANKTSKEDDSFKKNSTAGSAFKAKKFQDKQSSTPQKEESSEPEEEMKRKGETEANADKKQETQEREQEDGVDKQDSKMENAEVSEDEPHTMEAGDEEGPKSGYDTDDDNKKGSHKKEENSKPPVKARPQLNSLCENMDGPGLRLYITGQKKDLNAIRKELPSALKCSSDPLQLVLKAIEGYYASGSSSEVTPGKKLSHRRSCITLLEALTFVLDENDITDSVKGEVRKIADLWKSKLNPKGTDQIALLDVQSFLQLIATFRLADEYDEDELCELVVPICNRKHAPGLWRKLGLANKASDVVERLIQDGKQLDAVTFIQEYELAEKFPPVPLLKAYLKDIRQSHSTKGSVEDKDELHTKELSAAQAVLKCLEKYKLEAEYPTEGLRRRIVQLEKVTPEKKRSSDAAGGGPKKSRTNGPGGFPHSGPFRPSDRPIFGGRGGMGGWGNYGSAFGQGQGGSGGYPFPAGGPGYGPSTFSHGNYQYGGGPPYQGGSYMR